VSPPPLSALRPYLAAILAILLALGLLESIPGQITPLPDAPFGETGPTTWPELAIGILLLGGIIELIQVADAPSTTRRAPLRWLRLLALGCVMALYPWLFERVGFLTASIYCLLLLALLAGEQRPSRLIWLPLLPVALYLLGGWLGLPLQATLAGCG